MIRYHGNSSHSVNKHIIKIHIFNIQIYLLYIHQPLQIFLSSNTIKLKFVRKKKKQ